MSVQGLPTRNLPANSQICPDSSSFRPTYSSRKCMLSFKLSILVKSSMKFTVKSSFCKDSHPCKFSILLTLLSAKLRYRSALSFPKFSELKQLEIWHKLEEFRLVTNFLNLVVLEEKNLQLPATILNNVNPLEIKLMQCYLLQRGKFPFIVFCSFTEQIDCY